MRAFLKELLAASGNVIAHYYHKRNYRIEQKSNNTPVTMADQESEQVIRSMIEKRFPDHGIIGEEYGEQAPNAEYVWVIDPIDGTLAFIHGVPLFTTLIALLKNGRPILGAIHQPIANLICEGDNNNAWLNDEEIRMRLPSSIAEATMIATDVVNVWKRNVQPGFMDLLTKVKLFRTWGDGFGYILMASGQADIMLDAKMAPWDLLPVIPVVRGAGAEITTFSGEDPVTGDCAITAHPSLHSEVMRIIHQQ
jgi:histidinol phosphatase-like enzyme (inositol monophosphatase family)